MSATYALLYLLLYDFSFLAILFALAAYLSRNKPVAFAVLKRNFLGYFSSPTGYVFLCLFVLLTSMAAFWPHEFFSSNMGTLDQLNYWFPVIMLFFIPAITMSIWAEERRQGTDELLLTLPADDFDIVVGKYLSASSIYTASLLFSQISTFIVLCFLTLGGLDTGLFCVNYLGYWFIGLTMIGVGMVASFMTNNLTVGFILGALFNAPLAFASMADVIIPRRDLSRIINSWSLESQFDSFGRGVISSSAIAYFSLLAVLAVYACMILIGKRHWSGGKDGNQMFLHYLARVLLLAVIAVGLTYFFRNKDFVRQDLTEGQVSSLSQVTREMVSKLDPERPIVVDAFISAEVPELYAKTKYDLLSLLKEFESVAKRNGVPIEVNISDNLEAFSEEAKQAEQRYGIVPVTVRVRERGALTDQQIILGAAFRSGLEKVVIPFFEYGVPVEYELVRSLNTVAQPQRKKLGVVKNDSQFMGGFSMANMRQLPRQPIIDELSKQYDVKEVDLSSPIAPDQYDVLMVVQPSLLSPQEMPNLVAAVESGIPTAIFEDPFPFGFGFAATAEPKQSGGGGPFGGGGGMVPKGDLTTLLKAIGIDMVHKPAAMGGIAPDIVWQDYNPYPKLRQMDAASNEWIFVREEAPGAEDALSEASNITRGLREIMLMYAGTITAADKEKFEITELLSTGSDMVGTVPYQELNQLIQSGEARPDNLRMLQGPPTGRQVLAVEIRGKETAAEKKPETPAKEGEAKTETPESKPKKPVHAVFVADSDLLNSIFVSIRNRPEEYNEVDFRFQNVTFVLNSIDVLAGEQGYPEIRRHEPQHSTLALLEQQSEVFRQSQSEEQTSFRDNYDRAIADAEAENAKSIQAFEERVQKLQQAGAIDRSKLAELQEAMTQLEIERQRLQRILAVKKEQLERERDERIQKSRQAADLEIVKLQNTYKFLAIFIPPIPPLLVGVAVFVSRRLREREGIPKSRLK